MLSDSILEVIDESRLSSKEKAIKNKPHDLLVLVSSIPCGTSTSSLSTSWSRTDLQSLAAREILSWGGLPT